MTSVPSADSPSSNAANNGGAQSPTNSFSPDLNLFLKLLTTQLQNQDPLNPMDTSEYTQQLVQYSQVEQEMQQTGTLNNILASLSSQGVSQASSFIGREARFDTDTAGLKGDATPTWTYALPNKPSTLTATIKNSDGKVVKEIKLDPATEGRFTWDGKLDDGSTAPDGAYTLSLSAKTDSGADIQTTINAVGIVKDVVTDGQNVLLGVNGLRYSLQGLVGVSSAPTADS
jgi:flagellar basal-body rod modification protein FlgD